MIQLGTNVQVYRLLAMHYRLHPYYTIILTHEQWAHYAIVLMANMSVICVYATFVWTKLYGFA